MRLSIHGMGLAADFAADAADLLRLVQGESPGGGAQRAQEADTSGLAGLYSPRELRRIDHFTRMCLLASHRALDDSTCQPGEDTAIVLASGYGPARTTFDFLDSIIEFGEAGASPLAFSHSVHNIPAATVALQLRLPSASLSLCQTEGAVWAGLVASWTWLAEERSKRVLFIAADERTPLLDEVLGRMNPHSHSCDGAVAFILGLGTATGLAGLELDPAANLDARVADLRACRGCTPVGAAFDLAAAVALVLHSGGCALVCEDGRRMQVVA